MRKSIVLLLSVVLMMSFVGCGSKKILEDTAVVDENQVVFGRVTNLNGNEVTLALGDMKLQEKPDKEIAIPFEENGENITITVNDQTTIEISKDDNTDKGTMHDLKQDAIVSVVYDDGGNVATLCIMK